MLGFDGPSGRQRIPRLLERHPRTAVAASALFSGGLVFPRRTIRRAYDTDGVSVVGFRLMYNHASHRVLRMLREESVSVVHLTRRNVLRQVISRAQMHNAHLAAGTYRAHQSREAARAKKEPVRVHLENDEIVERVNRLIQVREETKGWLDAGVRHMGVTYEDLLSKGEVDTEFLTRISEFLGVENCFSPSDLGRTGSSLLSDVIADPADLKNLLEEQGLGWMVDMW